LRDIVLWSVFKPFRNKSVLHQDFLHLNVIIAFEYNKTTFNKAVLDHRDEYHVEISLLQQDVVYLFIQSAQLFTT
jgi:hypothetical protein